MSLKFSFHSSAAGLAYGSSRRHYTYRKVFITIPWLCIRSS